MPTIYVKFISDSPDQGDFQKGDMGIVAGFTTIGNSPYVAVVVRNKIVLSSFHAFEVIETIRP